MRWKQGRRSVNIEDRRGLRLSRGLRTGGIGGGLGLIGIVVALLLGVDPMLLFQGGSPTIVQTEQVPPTEGQDQLRDFVAVVLADTEDTWGMIFAQMGAPYDEPKLVLFTGAVESACGFAQAAVGPFYCPPDRKVYIDLTFFNELRRRFNAPGDFAQAYVIAHDVGHHVQTLMGIEQEVRQIQQQVNQSDANTLSVMLELQADCFAGVWAHDARDRDLLEIGDIDEALTAASAIGDDRIQQQTTGYVQPDSFTHGTSAQRVAWFSRGLKSGDPVVCNTFESETL